MIIVLRFGSLLWLQWVCLMSCGLCSVFFFPKFAICTGVDVTVTHNHIDLCGASVITSLFNYKNILLGLAFNDTRYLLLLRGWGALCMSLTSRRVSSISGVAFFESKVAASGVDWEGGSTRTRHQPQT